MPLPSVPEVELGSEEVFLALDEASRPQLKSKIVQSCAFAAASANGGGDGCSSGDSLPRSAEGEAMAPEPEDSPLVLRASIGPYEYAVLRADERQPMLDWLAKHRYFVPSGLEDAAAPYLHPGAYFLALKLLAGRDTADLQPVVLRYRSDLPMIPIRLTRVGAVRDMGILVWLLGEGRAVPRNFHHVEINDALAWLDPQRGYAALVAAARKEAPEGHAFTTDFSGSARVLDAALASKFRFGDPESLRAERDPVRYVGYLAANDYGRAPFPDPAVRAVLEHHLPMPADSTMTADRFYAEFQQSVDAWRDAHDGRSPYPDFDPGPITDEVIERIVTPLREAQALADKSKVLTRLYTTLSPEEMTTDPVFGWNPDLPDVARVREATVEQGCGPTELVTPSGLKASWFGSWPLPAAMPFALRVEALREAGPPEVVVDNRDAIEAVLAKAEDWPPNPALAQAFGNPGIGSGPGTECRVHRGRGVRGEVAVLLGAALVTLAIRARRRRGR